MMSSRRSDDYKSEGAEDRFGPPDNGAVVDLGGSDASRSLLRRSSTPLLLLRHGWQSKLLRISVVVGSLFVLHQLLFASSTTRQYVSSVAKPAYTGSEPSYNYKGAFESTLSRIGLKNDKLDPWVTTLEERLANPPLPPYNFLVGTMEHNESEDIVDWLLYHIAQGMEHFVVYDHFSTDNTHELLRPFVDLGWVTYVQYNQEGRWAQPLAFERFTSEWATHTKWLFFFDIDEYVARNETLLAGTGELDEPFATWFDRKYGDVGGVALPRLSFSSNGHYTRPDESPLSAYTETRLPDHNFYAPKVISQARFKKPGGDIHKQEYENGLKLVDPSGKSGDAMWEDGKKGEAKYACALYHYWSGSWEECVAKIKQTAFPGSWREQMGDKFCRQEMPSTEDHAEIPHYQDRTLAKYGPLVRLAKERFQARYPPFSASDYHLSSLQSANGGFSEKRVPVTATERLFKPESVFVLDSAAGPVGFVDVALSTRSSKRTLPINHRPDGSVSFALPPLSELDPGSGFHEITITLQHPAAPSPTGAEVSPCSVMGHIKNRPEVVQLQEMAKGVCSHVEPDGAWELQLKTRPHSHYRGQVLFRRFFQIEGVSSTSPPSSVAPATSSLPALGHGRWRRTELNDYHGGDATATSRLYISERCSNRFAPSYWDEVCGNSTTMYNPNGVYRWIPHGMSTYKDLAVPPEDLKNCLAAPGSSASASGTRPKRIVVVGDSVASHTYLALLCMMDQIPGLDDRDHVRFSSFQYESFNVQGTLDPLRSEDWARIVAWDWDAEAKVARNMPDVVVLNVGLWPVSWGNAEGYETGLKTALRRLKKVVASSGASTKIVWRETTSVHPSSDGSDPMHQTNPRVELFNEIANRIVDETGGIVRIPAYEMTASLGKGQSRDNAHVCPTVQGDMAELLMRGLCDHVLQ